MRVLLINSVCGIRSTGRICTDLARKFEEEGHEVKIAYGRVDEVPEQFQKYAVRIGNDLDLKLHALRTRILDEHGFGSKGATKEFLKWANEYNPDLVWLHNIHGYYINVEMLFAWIKSRENLQVKWTLHDCWAFTGHCSHFVAVKCEQWKNQCTICQEKHLYPASRLKNNCENNYHRKKIAFTGVKNLTLITPSKWLADLTRESFLKEYPVEVHYNEIDTSVFKETPSDFRKINGLEDKKVILGVASTWTERKGIVDLMLLSKMLNDKYVLVLVGISELELKKYWKNQRTREAISTNSIKSASTIETENGIAIPCDVDILYEMITKEKPQKYTEKKARILCVPRTNSKKELAEIYTAADILVNPTYEDTYPTVNLEAKACGTKIITYNVGGCVETLM